MKILVAHITTISVSIQAVLLLIDLPPCTLKMTLESIKNQEIRQFVNAI